MAKGFRAFFQYLASCRIDHPNYQADGGVRPRIRSIDVLRGLVMVVMALDHVRDFFAVAPYAPEDLSQTSSSLFLTRWVTHFCAPVFVLLSGTSAFLYGAKKGDPAKLSRFLLTRGIWLIAVELVIINLSWQSFWYGFMFLQVIWIIGWSMIFMALLIHLKPVWLFALSVMLLAGHNAFDQFDGNAWGSFSPLWALLHQRAWLATGPGKFGVIVVYPFLPWLGVMAAGYLLGPLFLGPAKRRQLALLTLGGSMLAGFLLLRGFNIYGDPVPWTVQARGGWMTMWSFLNTAKYPASLLFLLMTLGPALCALPLLEKMSGRIAKFLTVFGAVPFFFYVIHFPLINGLSHLWHGFRYGVFGHFVYTTGQLPGDYQLSLPLAYAVWVLVCMMLWWPCRWFAAKKRTHKTWWMSYL